MFFTLYARFLIKQASELANNKPAKGVASFFNFYTKGNHQTIVLSDESSFTLDTMQSILELLAAKTVESTAKSFVEHMG